MVSCGMNAWHPCLVEENIGVSRRKIALINVQEISYVLQSVKSEYSPSYIGGQYENVLH